MGDVFPFCKSRDQLLALFLLLYIEVILNATFAIYWAPGILVVFLKSLEQKKSKALSCINPNMPKYNVQMSHQMTQCQLSVGKNMSISLRITMTRFFKVLRSYVQYKFSVFSLHISYNLLSKYTNHCVLDKFINSLFLTAEWYM